MIWLILNHLINPIHCSLTCGGDLANETDSCTWKIETIKWSVGDKVKENLLWKKYSLIIKGMEKRAKIPSTILVKGSWLTVVGTTRSEVKFLNICSHNTTAERTYYTRYSPQRTRSACDWAVFSVPAKWYSWAILIVLLIVLLCWGKKSNFFEYVHLQSRRKQLFWFMVT